MPTAPDDEALQRACAEVERERQLSPVERRWLDVFREYAKAVARRYAATVDAGVPEEADPTAVFKMNDADMGSDSLAAYCSNGKMTVEIDEPWAGSTETGFGQTCSIGLSLDDAEAFAHWMLATVKRERAVERPQADKAAAGFRPYDPTLWPTSGG